MVLKNNELRHVRSNGGHFVVCGLFCAILHVVLESTQIYALQGVKVGFVFVLHHHCHLVSCFWSFAPSYHFIQLYFTIIISFNRYQETPQPQPLISPFVNNSDETTTYLLRYLSAMIGPWSTAAGSGEDCWSYRRSWVGFSGLPWCILRRTMETTRVKDHRAGGGGEASTSNEVENVRLEIRRAPVSSFK